MNIYHGRVALLLSYFGFLTISISRRGKLRKCNDGHVYLTAYCPDHFAFAAVSLAPLLLCLVCICIISTN